VKNKNIQIAEIIDAFTQGEPELFGKSKAELMPVRQLKKSSLVICDARLDKLVHANRTYGSHFASSPPLLFWQPGFYGLATRFLI